MGTATGLRGSLSPMYHGKIRESSKDPRIYSNGPDEKRLAQNGFAGRPDMDPGHGQRCPAREDFVRGCRIPSLQALMAAFSFQLSAWAKIRVARAQTSLLASQKSRIPSRTPTRTSMPSEMEKTSRTRKATT